MVNVNGRTYSSIPAQTQQHRVRTEWQWPFLTYIPSMMGKLAQPGEGWGLHARPLAIYQPSRTRGQIYTLPLALFLLYPYVLCGQQHRICDLLDNTDYVHELTRHWTWVFKELYKLPRNNHLWEWQQKCFPIFFADSFLFDISCSICLYSHTYFFQPFLCIFIFCRKSIRKLKRA